MKLIFLISFLIVGCSSCKSFRWEARPYSGDSENQQIVNSKGEAVKCNQPLFDEMTCFDAQNIGELIAEIERVNGLTKKQKREIKGIFKALKKSNPLYQLPDFVGGY